MNGSKIPTSMSMGRLRVTQRAKKYPEERIRSLAHHIDVDALRRAFGRIRKDAAVGVDGVTREAYADDGVFDFERREDAEKVMRVLAKRLARFALELSLDKTRLVDFQRPSLDQPGGKGRATFDFLGFTLYWRRSRKGRWVMTCKTRRARLQRAKTAIYDWCRRHRHLPVWQQHAALERRIQGHFNCFDVRGNGDSLNLLIEYTERAWFKWLNRRSQRRSYTWPGFADLLRVYRLPKPRGTIPLWGSVS